MAIKVLSRRSWQGHAVLYWRCHVPKLTDGFHGDNLHIYNYRKSLGRSNSVGDRPGEVFRFPDGSERLRIRESHRYSRRRGTVVGPLWACWSLYQAGRASLFLIFTMLSELENSHNLRGSEGGILVLFDMKGVDKSSSLQSVAITVHYPEPGLTRHYGARVVAGGYVGSVGANSLSIRATSAEQPTGAQPRGPASSWGHGTVTTHHSAVREPVILLTGQDLSFLRGNRAIFPLSKHIDLLDVSMDFEADEESSVDHAFYQPPFCQILPSLQDAECRLPDIESLAVVFHPLSPRCKVSYDMSTNHQPDGA